MDSDCVAQTWYRFLHMLRYKTPHMLLNMFSYELLFIAMYIVHCAKKMTSITEMWRHFQYFNRNAAGSSSSNSVKC